MVKVIYGNGSGYGIEDYLMEKREELKKAEALKAAGVIKP